MKTSSHFPAHLVRVAVVLLCAGAAVLAPAFAQTGAARSQSTKSPSPPAFAESVAVQVINVEAVVTDRQGVRAFGLTPQDFELLVDGQPATIEYFTEVRGGEALRENGHSPWSATPIAASQARGTSYLVFVDDFFTISTDRDRVLRALEQQLDLLGRDDRMAIVAWDGERVAMLTSWSGERTTLERALRDATLRPAYGLHRRAEREIFDTRPVFASLRRFSLQRDLDITERAYAARLTEQLERATAAAQATLRGFADPPGRKVLMLLSGGWPFSPGEFIAGPLAGAATFDYRAGEEVFGPLAHTANLLGYTLYPVDVPGLQDAGGNDASRDFAGTRRLNDIDFFRENEIQYTLRFLAKDTGGQALINGRREHLLEQVAADTRSFYWLGFVPSWSGDDAAHKIELRVTKAGHKVRSREGYVDLSPDRMVSMLSESALLFGAPASERPLGFAIVRAQPAGWGKMAVPVTLSIPATDVALLPGAGGYTADLQVRFAVMDDHGARAPIESLPLAVGRDTLPRSGDTIEYSTTLRMRRADHDVVVTVYDAVTGALWSTPAEIAAR